MEKLILFAPLLGGLISGFGGRFLGEKAAGVLATGFVMVACLLSWSLFLMHEGGSESIHVMNFIQSGTLDANWALRVDELTVLMLVLVTSLSVLIHVYAFGDLAEDAHWQEGEPYLARFFAYLGFATFAMLALVMSDNLLQVVFGWQGVSLAAYLLVGFYFKRPLADAAAIRIFVINRISDLALILAACVVFFTVDSLRFDDLFAEIPGLVGAEIGVFGLNWTAAGLIGLLLGLAAIAKSAQFVLHVWIDDTVEGPVSATALIHTATLLPAGVFLLSRMAPVLEQASGAMGLLMVIGFVTAMYGASVALVQRNIRRLLAYAVISQLGLIFVAIAAGAAELALEMLLGFGLVMALLELGAGAVIRALDGEQDMRRYGALRTQMPMSFGAMLIGVLALSALGLPLSGVGLDDPGYGALVLTMFLSGIYGWRMLFLTFLGDRRGKKKLFEAAHDGPWTMRIVLGVLGGAVLGIGVLVWSSWGGFAPVVAVLFGAGIAVWAYLLKPRQPARIAERVQPLYEFLRHGWYFEGLYQRISTDPAKALGTTLWQRGDRGWIDRAIHGLAEGLVPALMRFTGRVQSGYITTYAIAMAIGIAVLVLWMVLRGGMAG